MPDSPLVAHSLAEAYLYLRAIPCAACGDGPLRASDSIRVADTNDDLIVTLETTCGACQAVSTHAFHLPPGHIAIGGVGPARINPTGKPSQLVDVAQWLTLFRMIAEEAALEPDKVRARERNIEAAQCLEEALRLYDDPGNDLPGPQAFFHEASRRRFREHPEQFSKQRLINLRSKLPSESPLQSRKQRTETTGTNP